MNNPLFTIAIPVWKTRFLKEAVGSVLNQTIGDFELIIVNDDSPDPVEDVMSCFNDSRIRYFKNDKNIGSVNLVDNWNKCLAYARGKYFVLLGDDDMLEPDFMEVFVALTGEYPDLDVYHCRAKIINECSVAMSYTVSWPRFESVYENIWHRIKGFRLQFVSDFVYRTEALKQAGGFYKLPLAWASDDITVYRLIGTKGIAHTQSPVFCYRQNSLTISNTGNVFLKLEAVRGERLWLDDFLRTVPDNQFDGIIRANIIAYLHEYTSKKMMLTLGQWATVTDFLRIGKLNKSGLSFREIVMAFCMKLQFLVTRRLF